MKTKTPRTLDCYDGTPTGPWCQKKMKGRFCLLGKTHIGPCEFDMKEEPGT